MGAIYIIEHLERRVWKWCIYEYEHISQTIGKKNLWFTNVKRGSKVLSKYGSVFRGSVRDMKLDKACVLDSDGKKTLSPKEARGFRYFIFGGILGDHPPRKRTRKELTKFISNAIVRDIGKRQMATDNAVYVVHEIEGGTLLKKMKFKQGVRIRINKIESTDLPYRYALVNGEPFMSNRVVTYLKRKRD